MSNNFCISNHTFHNNTIAISNGNILNIITGMVTMNIFITGNATGTTCIFEGKDEDGNWYPVNCANLSSNAYANQTTGKNEVWQADLTSWFAFRIRISAITNGGLTIKGKVTN